MEMDANIQITDDEIMVMRNSDFFFTKKKLSNSIKALLAELRDRLKEDLAAHKRLFPARMDIETGKIFQGENYRLLPYILLDYPKMFNSESVFAFRTMFWWGNYFSFTLHLEGALLDSFRARIGENIYTLYGKGFYFCINESPWEYHFGDDNYVALEEVRDLTKLLMTKSFIKISRKIELEKWQELPSFARESFQCLLKILK